VVDQWFSPGTLVSSTNKSDRQDIAEILLNVALSTITLILNKLWYILLCRNWMSHFLGQRLGTYGGLCSFLLYHQWNNLYENCRICLCSVTDIYLVVSIATSQHSNFLFPIGQSEQIRKYTIFCWYCLKYFVSRPMK
jgi:hypothetical protein